jgi:hypothetical protein
MIAVLLLAIASASCSDADHASDVEFPLQGFWGGYFPGSSREDPRAGVEIHFERHGRNGFIHRDAGTAHRALVSVERDGNDVKITFDGTDEDDSTFEGRFVDADRIRGRFTNEARGESLPLELVRAESIGLTTPAPLPTTTLGEPTFASAAQAPLAPHVTLQIRAATESGTVYTFLFGLGYWFNPGRWTSADTIPNSPVPATGPTAVLQLLFFPSWIVFDAYAYASEVILSASIEVPISDFLPVDASGPRHLTYDDCSFVGVWPYDESVLWVEMQYVETDDWYDRVPWPTRTSDPPYTLEYDNETYQVPANAGEMLIGFGVQRVS